MRRARRPRNNNFHYRPLILNEIPAGCQQVLDVGCGAGMLARELSAQVPRVTGIDAGRAAGMQQVRARPSLRPRRRAVTGLRVAVPTQPMRTDEMHEDTPISHGEPVPPGQVAMTVREAPMSEGGDGS
jgi:SAM-dependent methyltransferase